MALDLGKQIGPLPLGAWAAIVAGGLGIAWYTRSGSAGSPADDTAEIDTSGTPGVGDGSVGGWTSTTPTTGSGSTTTEPVAVTTNEQWAQQAINYLIGRGYDPNLVDSAIRKYISGANDISVSEFTITREALLRFGSPPSPLPSTGQTPPVVKPTTPVITPPKSVPKPVVTAPKPSAPKPTSTVKKYRYYTVGRGDNLWNISKKFYGNGAKFGTIFNANRAGKKRADGKVGMIKSASLIQPGWVLLIP